MKNNPTVFIVTSVHNRREVTRQFLDQLINQTYSPIKVFIVDDGSTDGTSEMIEAEYPYVYLLHGDGNYWWSKSMNFAIKAVLTEADEQDIILTLNDDTILDDSYVETMVNETVIYPDTLVGSLNLIEENTLKIFSAGGKYDLLFSNHKPNIKYGIIYNKSILNDYYNTDFLPGRGTAIPVKVFKKIGYYDSERYPQYIADEEFSFRAKIAGFRCIVSSKAIVFVKQNTSGYENTGATLSLKEFFKSLTAINSTNNIKCRTNFAFSYARIPILFIIINISKIFLRNFASMFGLQKAV